MFKTYQSITQITSKNTLITKSYLENSILSNIKQNQRLFGYRARINKVQRVIRNPNFSKDGLRTSSVKKLVQYDLEQPHIVQPHLYYDHKTEYKQVLKDARHKKVEKRGEHNSNLICK